MTKCQIVVMSYSVILVTYVTEVSYTQCTKENIFFINRIYDDRAKTRKTSHVKKIVTRWAASTLLDSIHFPVPEKIGRQA